MKNIPFAIIGGGWRALFFLRIAKELTERFTVTSMLVRDPEKGASLTKEWGVPTYQSLDELLATKPKFVVASVSWEMNPVFVKELHTRGIPVLCETPPAPDLESLIDVYNATSKGTMVQVAEQYHLQPMNASRISVAKSGKLGTITEAQVSLAHGYHGISMMRKLLGVEFEPVTITARNFSSPIVAGPGREGPPTEEMIDEEARTLAWFDYGNKLGVFDFTGTQYFSWVRSIGVRVRGVRGELNTDTARYLKDYRTPITLDLMRHDKGHGMNLERYSLKGITFGDEWIYENPFFPGRLPDDEIAIADCLKKMSEYIDGGPSFYSLAEACQDHYLGITMHKAADTGEVLVADPQVWAG